MKLVPLSVNNFFGNPSLQNTLHTKTFAIVSASWFGKAKASAHFN